MRCLLQVAIVGLGLLAGAVLQPAAAQVPPQPQPQPRDTVRIPIPPQPDTIVRRDSGAREAVPPAPPARADTLQPAFAQAELPHLAGTARLALRWTRDSVLATGAMTLADLLESIPGFTSLRAGWLGLPVIGSYNGDVGRVRVFLDGLELDPAEPRGGTSFELGRIPLWAADEVRVEQTAGELRVHVRSWQVDRTTPYSRADVATGDQDTDLFRFFFGRRFGNGLGLQAAVEQYSTTPDRVGATNSQTSILARVGWARRNWQADAFLLRYAPHRGVLFDDDAIDSLPSIDVTRTESYLRFGYGDVNGPAWAQLIAGAHGHRYTGVRDPLADSVIVEVDTITGDTTRTLIPNDTSRFEAQYVFTAGLARRFLRASVTHRMRVIAGETYQTPSARLSTDWRMLSASLTVEGEGPDSLSRRDVSVTATPLGFLRLAGSWGSRTDAGDGGRSATDWRGSAAVRVGRLWLGGGLMSRGETTLPAARVFGERFTAAPAPAATGTFASVQGHIWGPLQVDLLGERWQDTAMAYRPQWRTRADVFVRSNFLERFPTNNFGLYTLLRHEYRSANFFPTAAGFERTPGHRIFTFLLEIRILDATLSYQFRNLLASRFEMVPNYQMPRQTQFYGVRWTFWN